MELAGALEDNDLEGYFVYLGREDEYHCREDEVVPEDMIRVWVHPSVKIIRRKAFFDRRQLTTVILNHGLEEIGRFAFSKCTSLRGIDVPPTVKSIKYESFRECSSLTTVTLHDGLEEIGAWAFVRCTSLRGIDVPPTVKSIKDYAFGGCSTLTTVTLHDGLEEIGGYAFFQCTSLRGIDVPPTVKSIKSGAFSQCSLRVIDVPPTIKSIKDRAFYQCSSLTTVTLHDGLEEIGVAAFRECTSLQRIDVPPKIKTIKKWAFCQCSSLTTVTLHDGLEEIGEEAFLECTSLERIRIPPTIKAIHDSAFKGCSQLNRVVFRNEIEEFANCDAMRGWWDQVLHENRVHEATLKTYHFLFRCSIPERLGAVPIPLQANVYEMLRCIPTMPVVNLNAHLDSIDSRLTSYEYLIEEIFPFLELAIWKSTSSRRSLEEDDVILNIFSMI
jgi:hypothetical protein